MNAPEPLHCECGRVRAEGDDQWHAYPIGGGWGYACPLCFLDIVRIDEGTFAGDIDPDAEYIHPDDCIEV